MSLMWVGILAVLDGDVVENEGCVVTAGGFTRERKGGRGGRGRSRGKAEETEESTETGPRPWEGEKLNSSKTLSEVEGDT